MKISIGFIFIASAFFYSVSGENNFNNEEQKVIKDMKLKITIGDDVLTATLYDTPTTRDWISMLPVTTKMEDHAGNEKIYYPKRKLSTEGAPNGYKPSKGDITYYAPWGDIAIFYKDFSYAKGLISLGEIDDNGIEKLSEVNEDNEVTFELLKE